MGYSDYRKATAPPWLRGPVADRWHETLGSQQDALVARAKDAVKAGFLPSAPTDALWRIGEDCRLEQLPAEGDEAYRARLARVHEIWEKAGTARGLVEAFRDAGYFPRLMTSNGETAYWDRSVAEAADGFVVEVLPGGWSAHPRPAFWSAYHVLFPGPHPWAVDGGIAGLAGLLPGATVMPGGWPDAVHEVEVEVTTAGAVADGGVKVVLTCDGDISAPVTVPKHGVVVFDEGNFLYPTGIAVTLAGSFLGGEIISWTTGVFPASNSPTVELFRRMIRQWHQANATCSGIVVHCAGQAWGWPRRTWGGESGAAGVWGGGFSHVWSA